MEYPSNPSASAAPTININHRYTEHLPPPEPPPAEIRQSRHRSHYYSPTSLGSHSSHSSNNDLPYDTSYTHRLGRSLPELQDIVAYASVDPFKHNSPKPEPSLPVSYEPYYQPSLHVGMPYGPYPRRHFLAKMWTFLSDTLPRELYLEFLLHLPAYYWSRVARIFEEAKMTMPEIREMALQGTDPFTLQELPWTSPAGANLKATWESFIDSLVKEWKTLNIISVLLLSAILTILQIDSAAADPIARHCALFSLICALMSLLYGCMFIIRFAGMRKTYKAIEWAEQARKNETLIFWNVWVLLAMPATWLGWSIMLYIACIMAFVWRTTPDGADAMLHLSSRAQLGLRVGISAVLGLGVLYFILMLSTLRSYGARMDKEFEADLAVYVAENKREHRHRHRRGREDSGSYSDITGHLSPPHTRYDLRRRFQAKKVMDLRFLQETRLEMPSYIADYGLRQENWDLFLAEASMAWNLKPGALEGQGQAGQARAAAEYSRPQDRVTELISRWNQAWFKPLQMMGALCIEYPAKFPESPSFAIYLLDISSPNGEVPSVSECFGPLPGGLTRIDIFSQDGRPRRHVGSGKLSKTSIFPPSTHEHRRSQFPENQRASSALSYNQPRWRRFFFRRRGGGRDRRPLPFPGSNGRVPMLEPVIPQPPRNENDVNMLRAGVPQYPPTNYHPVDIEPNFMDHLTPHNRTPSLAHILNHAHGAHRSRHTASRHHRAHRVPP